MEVRPLRVGKAALGLVVQTPEWLAEQLIPTLKKQQPTLYAQQVNRMLPTVGIIAAADKSAFDLRVKIKAVVRAAWSTIPVTDLAGNDATVSDLKAQLRKLESETDASFRHIEHAAEKSSRLVSHGARSWKNVQQSERDIREVQLLCNRAATAHTRLEALLSEARRLLHTQTHPDTGMTKLLKFLHLAPDTSDSDSELDT